MIVASIAFITFTLATQYFSSKRTELVSEIGCWVILPLLLRATRPYRNIPEPASRTAGSDRQSSRWLWIGSVCLAATSLYKAEFDSIGLFPLLTPLLLATHEYLRAETYKAARVYAWLFSLSALRAVSCGLLASLTLSVQDHEGTALSIALVAASYFLYSALLLKTSGESAFVPHLQDVEKRVTSLSWRTVLLTSLVYGVHTRLFGFENHDVYLMITTVFSKALSWMSLIHMTEHLSWCIVPGMQTFSLLAIRNLFAQKSQIIALWNVVASMFSLAQVVHMFPKTAKSATNLWIFVMVPLVPFILHEIAIRNATTLARSSFTRSHQHPVTILAQNARHDFEALLQRQSKDYSTAQAEYRRRYAMEPPGGFQQWFEFASMHNSSLIDDFDTIHNQLAPFFTLGGDEITRILNEAYNEPENELWLCEYSSADHKTRCSHPRRTFDRHFSFLLDRLLSHSSIVLPDVKFLVNHLDEPRVVTYRDPSKALNSSAKAIFNMTDLTRRSTWKAATSHCSSMPGSDSSIVEDPIDKANLLLVENMTSAMDLCQHAEYAKIHGLLMSPVSFRLINGLVPVLSTGSLSTNGDFLFPSPAYIEEEFKYEKDSDFDWDRKHNNLYWRGSTSGAFAKDDQWPNFHRQRFVRLVQNLEKEKHIYLHKKIGTVSRVKTSFLNTRLFDVAFTRIYQCARKYCRQQKTYFRTQLWADKNRALQSKLVFDTDGNGISGRYYGLLASNSAPLKQTLFQEWHDDRLIPWLHYIPVSQSLEELPEVVSYLTLNVRGQQTAKEVAEQGKDWFGKAFREVDMSIYVYRLLLELARLQNPARQGS
ncbi:glycosyltransferase family 90 protein [Lophiostoma macrostomum CBS 122681]|uniref:Glycosyltransferase family 90 protein n=1 Tax=Lophiostoma macrostomum CBS 122681 TaxID=1314788 RepID=A0A6A6T5J7_9PLEO|nr:glycosyltransferase family 90 protein [Lophiostoma macrostomum CBS 122681]